MGESSVWWAQTFEMVSQRLGIDMKKQTVAVHPRVATTIGGITADEHGRAVKANGPVGSQGFTLQEISMFCLHGAGLVAGNRLLDAMAGGAAAGEHAAD